MSAAASLDSLFTLAGRVALVTGASSGIGRLMARTLAEAGASVILVARRESQLTALRDELQEDSLIATTLVGDLTQRDAIPELARKAEACFGSVHILVNAAGVNLRQPVDDDSDGPVHEP